MAAWLFFVLFFLAYMFNADRVYHALSGKAYSVKLPDDSALYAKGDVQYNWSPWGIKTVNDKFEAKLMFSGSVSKVANKSGNAKADEAIQAQTIIEMKTKKLTIPIRALGTLSVVLLMVIIGLWIFHTLSTPPPM